MKIDELLSNARRASNLLKAMGNERRLLILCHLAIGERSVGELETLIELSQSALSQHLARLRRDGLVRTRRCAQNIYYSLSGEDAKAVMSTLHRLYCDRLPVGEAHALTMTTARAAALP
jgi:ArsR family transcriptional regulator, virulence genes transcriptional regulator